MLIMLGKERGTPMIQKAFQGCNPLELLIPPEPTPYRCELVAIVFEKIFSLQLWNAPKTSGSFPRKQCIEKCSAKV